MSKVKPNQKPYLALPTIEATCEACGAEMQVEMPEGVLYKNPDFWNAPEEYEEWSHKAKQKTKADTALDMINHVIDTFDKNIGGKFRKRTRKMLIGIQHEAEHAAKTYRDEFYDLNNKLYPPVGENSTD